jgi:hypothetical protein
MKQSHPERRDFFDDEELEEDELNLQKMKIKRHFCPIPLQHPLSPLFPLKTHLHANI